MLSPLPMKHISIQVLTDDLPSATLILAQMESFSPDSRPFEVAALPEVPGRVFRSFYAQAKARLEKIAAQVDYNPSACSLDVGPISEEELDDTNQWLGDAWETGSGFEESRRLLQEERRSIDQLEGSLANFRNLHIDLGQLQAGRGFLESRIGTLHQTQVAQLSDALGLDGYLLFPYMQSESESHVIILGPSGREKTNLDAVLDTAGFHPLEIPPELQAEPEAVESRLQQRRLAVEQATQALDTEIHAWGEAVREGLEHAACVLHLAAPYVTLGEAARNQGDLSRLQGWVPALDLSAIEDALSEKLANPFVMESRDPLPDERPLVPSVVRHNRLLKPFSLLVMQYGIPRYGEFNPTHLFAFTYVLMFGMMFGDVGHGAVILGLSLLFRRKLGAFTPFGITTGLSSMLFGALYGSLFGFEHLFQPIWIAPLSDPLYMLGVALACGVVFIILVSLLNILNRLLQGDRLSALWGDNGLLSLLLYIGLLGMGYSLYTSGHASVFWASLASLALIGIFAHKLIEQEATIGERLLVAFIETFETVTGYASNTLSFLRVAAFSLNHVALAIAVFTLADKMEQTGYWITVVLGNLFILVLEGLIVYIQVLRLEYYEGFTRFYSGDGKAFKPLTL